MLPSGCRLNLLRDLIAQLYTRPFDRSLVTKVAQGACCLLDSQYLSLCLFSGDTRGRPFVLSNNPPDYLPIYFEVAPKDFLRNWVALTHQEFILRRMRGQYEPENSEFTRTVQAARPVSDIVYLPIVSGETLQGFWSLARAGLGQEAYDDEELATFRFLVAFLNEAYQRSLLPPATQDDTAYLDSRANVVVAGSQIREAFLRSLGTEQPGRGGNDRAREFRWGYRAFLAGPTLGASRILVRDGVNSSHFAFELLSSLHEPTNAGGQVVARVKLVRCQPDQARVDFGLTAREQQVVDGIMKGWSNKVIALGLGIDESTVKRHTHNIYEKTPFRSRVELVLGLGGSSPRRSPL